MSERFVTEKDAEVDRAKKQEEWDRVRKSTDPLEAPDAKQEPGDARPLFEKLQDNRMKEQEAIFAQRAFSKCFLIYPIPGKERSYDQSILSSQSIKRILSYTIIDWL